MTRSILRKGIARVRLNRQEKSRYRATEAA
jgi:hypothetical protein